MEETWERDCNIRTNRPAAGVTLVDHSRGTPWVVVAWRVCGTWSSVCLSSCLAGWLAGCLSPTRAWGTSEGFARWGQLK